MPVVDEGRQRPARQPFQRCSMLDRERRGRSARAKASVLPTTPSTRVLATRNRICFMAGIMGG